MKVLPAIDAACRDFIGRQRIFFAASAAPGAHVNLSPRGTDLFAVLDDLTVAYLDKTGSGAETAAHLKADGRLTLLFCAFDGPPNILRLYGRGEVLRRGSAAYRDLLTSAFGASSRPARARSSACMSIGCRPRAVTAFPGSTIAASGHRSTIGRPRKARTASTPTGGRRTGSASTACPRDCSTTREGGPARPVASAPCRSRIAALYIAPSVHSSRRRSLARNQDARSSCERAPPARASTVRTASALSN